MEISAVFKGRRRIRFSYLQFTFIHTELVTTQLIYSGSHDMIEGIVSNLHRILAPLETDGSYQKTFSFLREKEVSNLDYTTFSYV